MFESILQKKKVYVVKLYNNQKYAIRYFKKKGVIKYLGDFKNLNYKNFKAVLLSKVNFKKLNEKFDGRGLNRVISKIIPYINKRTTWIQHIVERKLDILKNPIKFNKSFTVQLMNYKLFIFWTTVIR